MARNVHLPGRPDLRDRAVHVHRGHPLQPLAGVVEHLDLDRFHVLPQHVVDLAGRHLLALLDETGPLHRGQQVARSPCRRRSAGSAPARSGKPPGSGATAPKSITPILLVGHQHEIPRMRVAVHHLQPPRRVVGQLEQPGAHEIALSGVPSRMICDIGMPSIHSAMTTLGALATIAGTTKCGSSLVGLGEGALVVGLQPVVEFHLGAFDQLVDHALRRRRRGRAA